MAVLCNASKLRDMHDDDVEFVADKYFDGNTPKSIKQSLDEKANKDGISPALVLVNDAKTSKEITDVINAGNIPYYRHSFANGEGGMSVNLYYAASTGSRNGGTWLFVGHYGDTTYKIIFDSRTDSFGSITETNFLKSTDTINATTINGHRIVVGSLGTDPNTIYIF